jgi:hypothetical protein
MVDIRPGPNDAPFQANLFASRNQFGLRRLISLVEAHFTEVTDAGPNHSLGYTGLPAVHRSYIRCCAVGTSHSTDGHSSAIDRRDRALGAATAQGRDNADAAAGAIAGRVLAARALDLGRHELDLAAGSVR